MTPREFAYGVRHAMERFYGRKFTTPPVGWQTWGKANMTLVEAEIRRLYAGYRI